MLDEQIIEKLSAYADGELDAQAAGEVERALAQDAALRSCLAQFKTLDGTAAALPVPRMGEAAGAVIWQAVRALTAGGGTADLTPAALNRVEAALDEPPVISDDRWRQAWTHVRAQTTDARLRPVDADLTPGPLHALGSAAPEHADGRAAPVPLWRSFAAMAAAAVVLLVATLSFIRQDTNTNVVQPRPPTAQLADVSPEALDQRYFVMVKHMPGIEQPVVCFFLKEPDPDLDDVDSWQ